MRLEQLLIASAARTPEAQAVCGPDGRFTYCELDALAERIAGELDALGVRWGDRVVLMLDKSVYCVAAMQAVLRLGAVYVPLDPHLPARRAATLLSDCAPSALVLSAQHLLQLREAGEQVPGAALVAPEVTPTGPAPIRRVRPAADEGADELAYVLYTSGSTGQPKGVCVTHANALAFVDWAGDLLELAAHDRLANHAPFQFDLSVFDLYAAFRAGASVHLVPDGLPSRGRVRFLRQHGISVSYSVPSVLVLMMEYGDLLAAPDLPLRAVVFAGEVFPPKQLRLFRERYPALTLLNFYGPTETNVCAYHRVPEVPAEQLPIGTAASGNRIWAVLPDGTPAPHGQEGELMVAGPTVMAGYHGEPRQGGRPYATGDIVREIHDGEFVFIGRRDHLVKIRGHRIGLGEIESALGEHPDIAAAAVVVVGEGLRARLHACVVTRRGWSPTTTEIKRFLAERLPQYMIVDRLLVLPELPLTATGKIDYRGLKHQLRAR